LAHLIKSSPSGRLGTSFRCSSSGRLATLAFGLFSRSFEQHVGAALKRLGKKKWTKNVFDVVKQLKNALQVEYVVLGRGSSKRPTTLPPATIRGENEAAREGGFPLCHQTRKRTRDD
jgi:hypothetical protein